MQAKGSSQMEVSIDDKKAIKAFLEKSQAASSKETSIHYTPSVRSTRKRPWKLMEGLPYESEIKAVSRSRKLATKRRTNKGKTL